MKKQFPTLFHKGKTGAIVQWDIWTEGADIVTRYGQIDGKLQLARSTAEAKNVGKANETTGPEQAIKEAKAMWKKRIDGKYSETVEASKEMVFLPMLAADAKKKKFKGIHYPADVQPKLDGVRAMAYWEGDRVVLGTRSGKEWEAPSHINKILEKYLPKEMVLDGELYLPGVDFETLSSWTKKVHPGTETLEYHIFDVPLDKNGDNLKWEERKSVMAQLFVEMLNEPLINFVPLYLAWNEAQILELEEQCVSEGYEGCMVRNLDASYLFGHRSNDLQKVKSSVDDDYKIIGFNEGRGRDKGCVVWVCETLDKKPFDVRPKATLEKRAEWFKSAKKYVGQFVKVAYQNLTADGIPRFPRSIGFRDERDM
jgi:DNA ligase 1